MHFGRFSFRLLLFVWFHAVPLGRRSTETHAKRQTKNLFIHSRNGYWIFNFSIFQWLKSLCSTRDEFFFSAVQKMREMLSTREMLI